MASLATITKESRLILRIGAMLGAGFFLLYIFVNGGALVKSIFFPKPAPPPVQKFGKLPPLLFLSKGTAGIQFNIKTITGELPHFSDRANVYELIKPEPNLLALKTAREKLYSESFSLNEHVIKDTLYQWTQDESGATINYDILTKNFTISSAYLSNPALGGNDLLPTDKDIIAGTVNFVQNLGIDTSDIDVDNSKVTPLQLVNGTTIVPENRANARYAQVNLVQLPVDKLGISYPQPDKSIMNLIVSFPKQTTSLQILQGEFFHYMPNKNNVSDYPIKTPTQALEDLKNGNAYMSNPQNLNSVDITDVVLHYYLNETSNGYLMPIYIFTGINFTGYVNAIPDSSLAPAEEATQ